MRDEKVYLIRYIYECQETGCKYERLVIEMENWKKWLKKMMSVGLVLGLLAPLLSVKPAFGETGAVAEQTLIPDAGQEETLPPSPATEEPQTENPSQGNGSDSPTQPETEQPAVTRDPNLPMVNPGASTDGTVQNPSSSGQWNEESCDHANINCAQAPACDKNHDQHITTDVHGLQVGQCKLGRWLLDRQDELFCQKYGEEIRSFTQKEDKVIDLNLGGALIRQSGTYLVTGGTGEEKIEIAPNRIVNLILENTLADAIILCEKTMINILPKSQNSWRALELKAEGEVRFMGTGALTIAQAVVDNSAYVDVARGNVNIRGIEDKNGRKKYVFPGQGAASIAVEDKVLAEMADANGDYHVWLTPVGGAVGGITYVANLEGDRLVITAQVGQDQQPPVDETMPETQQPEETPDISTTEDENIWGDKQSISISSGQKVTISGLLEEENKAYQITFGGSQSTLVLENIQLAAGSTLTILNAGTNDIYIGGDNGDILLENMGTLNVFAGSASSGIFNISGSGNTFWQGNAEHVRLLNQPVKMAAIEEGEIGQSTVFMNQGVALSLVWVDSKTFLIPQSMAGNYGFALENNTLEMQMLPDMRAENMQTAALADEDMVLAAYAETKTIDLGTINENINLEIGFNYHLKGSGSLWSYEVMIPADYEGTVTLENTNIQTVTLPDQGNIAFELSGSNQIAALTGGGAQIGFSQGGNLKVTAWQAAATPGSTFSNIQITGERSFSDPKESVVLVRDQNGQVAGNQSVTVKIGDEAPYQVLTFEDGTFWVWGKTVTQTNVLINDGTYQPALIMINGEPQAQAPITNEQGECKGLEATITFSSPAGNSAGIMYIVGDGSEDLPASHVQGAYVAESLKDSKGIWKAVVRDGLVKGKVITYRAFSSTVQGLVFGEDTAQHFNFSQQTHTLIIEGKQPFPIDDVQPSSKFYDGEPYAFANTPEGVSVSFATAGGKVFTEPPINAGSYKAIFEVPENHPDYFAGTFEKAIVISKTQNPVQVSVVQTTYGQKLQTYITGNLGGEPQIIYRGIRDTSYQSSVPPKFVGSYEVVITISGSENVADVELIMPFNIYPKKVIIWPEDNLMKFEGEEDPAFSFYYDGILPGEEYLLEGFLFRALGEDPGSYPYTVKYLSAGENYVFELSPYAGTFTILPAEDGDNGNGDNGDGDGGDGSDGGDGLDGGGGGGGGGEGGTGSDKIIPVHQKVKLYNGKTLDVVLNTAQTLNINGREYARLIWDTEDNKVRPFSPSLRVTQDATQVLLQLETEPELKKDGGYLTDTSGNKVYRGRRLELSYSMIGKLKELGITHMNLGVKNASVLIALDDLLNPQVTQLAKDNLSSVQKGVFHITIVPKLDMQSLMPSEQEILMKENLLGDVYKMEVEMVLGKDSYDITALLSSARFQIGAEEILRIMDIAKSEVVKASPSPQPSASPSPQPETTPEASPETEAAQKPVEEKRFEIVSLSSQGKLLREDTWLIEPFMESEKQMLFINIRGTQRYCTTGVKQEGLYFINYIQEKPAESPGGEETPKPEEDTKK